MNTNVAYDYAMLSLRPRGGSSIQPDEKKTKCLKFTSSPPSSISRR